MAQRGGLACRVCVSLMQPSRVRCPPPAPLAFAFAQRARTRPQHARCAPLRARASTSPPPPLPARTPSAAAAAAAHDDELSRRPLTLDGAGYFLISARHGEGVIVAEHYCNVIDSRGLACDPRTGEVIPCTGYMPPPPRTFRGATAKAVAVAILETPQGEGCVSRLEHAAYLGRELQKAEQALRDGTPYVQD